MFVMSFSGSFARKIKGRSSRAFCRFKQKPSIYERTELQNV